MATTTPVPADAAKDARPVLARAERFAFSRLSSYSDARRDRTRVNFGRLSHRTRPMVRRLSGSGRTEASTRRMFVSSSGEGTRQGNHGVIRPSWIDHRAMILWVSIKCLILMVVGTIALSLDGLSDDATLPLSILVGAIGFFRGSAPSVHDGHCLDALGHGRLAAQYRLRLAVRQGTSACALRQSSCSARP